MIRPLSLLRRGIAESDLAALWRVTVGGRAIEAFSVHLPIDRPPGTAPAAQTARWVSVLTERVGTRLLAIHLGRARTMVRRTAAHACLDTHAAAAHRSARTRDGTGRRTALHRDPKK